METTQGYFDFCIPEHCIQKCGYENTIKNLYENGYRTIVIEQTFNEEQIDSTKKNKKGETRNIDSVPVPFEIKPVEGCENLKVFNRLTVIFSNSSSVAKIIQSPNFERYHILAVIPTTQQALLFVCDSFEADIFSYRYETNVTYKLNRKLYRQLVERGVYFELMYAPVIEDSTKRKGMIALSHKYYEIGKSKNVVLSSGATHTLFLRNCYDVINFGYIFGLGEEKAISSVLHCGRNIISHSISRRNGKGILMVENLSSCESSSENNSGEETTIEPATKKCKT